MTDCYACHENATYQSLQPRHLIWDGDAFRVAHSFNSALPGWVVIVSNRHVECMSDLTPSEAVELAELMMAVPLAIERLLDVPKAYVLFLAESEGFTHLHVHVVPRAADLPEDRRGTRIFEYLKQPAEAWVSEAEQDRIGIALRPLVHAAMEKLER